MFADDLKDARVKAGITGREAARRSGISSAYYSQLETGKREKPPAHVLSRIAAALGVETAYFASDACNRQLMARENSPGEYTVNDRPALLAKMSDLERQLERANDTIAAQARTIESMQRGRAPAVPVSTAESGHEDCFRIG